jgi:hypothetical protein
MGNERVDIRSTESHAREARAKALAHSLLIARGYGITAEDHRGNRHVISAIDPTGRQIALWFKLGWNPASHGTSAIQITMLKVDDAGLTPAQWSDNSVLEAVRAKCDRARQDEVTHLLLFSLEADNDTPLAAWVMPIQQVPLAFADCLAIDAPLARKGASPSLWLRGSTTRQSLLAEAVRARCIDDLLGKSLVNRDLDSINDLEIGDDVSGDKESPTKVTRLMASFRRDRAVRERVIERANGHCEYCGRRDFTTYKGKSYLEAHHILSLAANGPDKEHNVIALCASHHREAHFGAAWEAMAEQMLRLVAERQLTLQPTAGS